MQYTDLNRHQVQIFNRFVQPTSTTTLKSAADKLGIDSRELFEFLIQYEYDVDNIAKRAINGDVDYLTKEQFNYYLVNTDRPSVKDMGRYFNVSQAKAKTMFIRLFGFDAYYAKFTTKQSRVHYDYNKVAEQIRELQRVNPSITRKELAIKLGVTEWVINTTIKTFADIEVNSNYTNSGNVQYTKEEVLRIIKSDANITSIQKLTDKMDLTYSGAYSLINRLNIKEAIHDNYVNKRTNLKKSPVLNAKTFKKFVKDNRNKTLKEMSGIIGISYSTLRSYITKYLDKDIDKKEIIKALRAETFKTDRALAFYLGVQPTDIQRILNEYNLEVFYTD